MSQASEMHIECNEALDLYVKYFDYDGEDGDYNDELRWDFIEAAVKILEKATGRSVADEVAW